MMVKQTTNVKKTTGSKVGPTDDDGSKGSDDVPKQDEIAEFLLEEFGVYRSQLDSEIVAFERVVYTELCSQHEASIEVYMADYDFSEKGDLLPKKGIHELVRKFLAFSVYHHLFYYTKPLHGDDGVQIKKFIDELLEIFNDDSGKPRRPSKDKPIQHGLYITATTIRSLINDKKFQPRPTMFDIKFEGPTAIVLKSHIDNLRFRPDGSIFFNNRRDEIYYRNDMVSEDYKTLAFVNAYKAAARINDRLHRKRNGKTPRNQEHKIDYGMYLCSFGVPNTLDGEDEQWLATPIKIDPPHINPGDGG